MELHQFRVYRKSPPLIQGLNPRSQAGNHRRNHQDLQKLISMSYGIQAYRLIDVSCPLRRSSGRIADYVLTLRSLMSRRDQPTRKCFRG